MTGSIRSVLLLIVALAAGCSGTTAEKPPNEHRKRQDASAGSVDRLATSARFVEMAESSGVDFTYRNGEEAGHFSILESLGGGVALFDYDADGQLDLFLPGGGEFGPDQEVRGLPPALYRSRGHWEFAEVTQTSGTARADYYSHGAAVADYDADGFPDVLVTGYGGLLLFRNQGDGTFSEVARASGLTDELWSSSAAWGDLDDDGHLDLYVAHYVDWSFENHPLCAGPQPGQREVCPPRQFTGLPDALYMSNGDGSFHDASAAAGLSRHGKGLGVIIADVDVDGRLDIYVANDTVPNFLYRNSGSVRLEEMGLISGTSLSDVGIPDGSMGVDLGDYNLDGLPDLWVANYERESFALYRNEGTFVFQHVSQATGVTAVGGLYVGWGTVFFDFDADGDEDVFVSNGHVIRHPVNAPLDQTPLLYENRGGTRLVNVAPAARGYMTRAHMGRGVAAGDLDGDGDLDLGVSRTNQPVALLSNESRGANHWLGLRLIGVRSPRQPVGAIAELHTPAGVQTRQLKGGTSYASSSDPRLYFGLGGSPQVDRVRIRWPSGVVQTISPARVDTTLTVVEQPG